MDKDKMTTRVYTLSLHDALPILRHSIASCDGHRDAAKELGYSIRGPKSHLGRIEFEIDVERSEEKTSELHSLTNSVCRLMLEKIKNTVLRLIPPLMA